VLTGALRTHPVLSASGRQPSRLYEPPNQLLSSLGEPLPPVVGAPLATLALGTGAVSVHARAVLVEVATPYGWRDERLDSALLVLTEVVTNSLRHGAGDRLLSVWVTDTALTCEITDQGAGLPDPLLGYRPPGRDSVGGRGLWIAYQLSDWLAVEHIAGTTRVRFSFTR
jgi:anti-sigma regulatory factor (Ser/Thr protein kinase)